MSVYHVLVFLRSDMCFEIFEVLVADATSVVLWNGCLNLTLRMFESQHFLYMLVVPILKLLVFQRYLSVVLCCVEDTLGCC